MARQTNRLAHLSKAERADERARALELFKAIASTESPTIYAIIRHVSDSGMSRRVQFLVPRGNTIRDVSYEVAIVTDSKLYDDGVRLDGCDMVYYIVTSVSYAVDPARYDLFRVTRL